MNKIVEFYLFRARSQDENGNDLCKWVDILLSLPVPYLMMTRCGSEIRGIFKSEPSHVVDDFIRKIPLTQIETINRPIREIIKFKQKYKQIYELGSLGDTEEDFVNLPYRAEQVRNGKYRTKINLIPFSIIYVFVFASSFSTQFLQMLIHLYH